MPWANCAFPQCGSCRRYELSIFKILNQEGDFYEKWKTNILNVLNRFQMKNSKMAENIKAETAFICERHLKELDAVFRINQILEFINYSSLRTKY